MLKKAVRLIRDTVALLIVSLFVINPMDWYEEDKQGKVVAPTHATHTGKMLSHDLEVNALLSDQADEPLTLPLYDEVPIRES